jgi:hypothetical protein
LIVARTFLDVIKMAANTMDAIKKKMQAMRMEKSAAHDKADLIEKKLVEQRILNEQVRALLRSHRYYMNTSSVGMNFF